MRYDDGDEHLNVEATSLGFNTYPDEHYRHWPLPTTDAEARQYGLLRPLNNREVLGAFLTIRANCLRIAAERVPPECWQGIPPALEPQLRGLTTEEQVVAELWEYHAGQVNRATLEAAAALAAQRRVPMPPSSRMQGQPPSQAAQVPPVRSFASPGPQPGAVPGSYSSVAGGFPAAGPPIQIEIIPAKTNP